MISSQEAIEAAEIIRFGLEACLPDLTLPISEGLPKLEGPRMPAVKVSEFVPKNERQCMGTVGGGKSLCKINEPLFDDDPVQLGSKHGNIEEGRFAAHHPQLRRRSTVPDRAEQASVDPLYLLELWIGSWHILIGRGQATEPERAERVKDDEPGQPAWKGC